VAGLRNAVLPEAVEESLAGNTNGLEVVLLRPGNQSMEDIKVDHFQSMSPNMDMLMANHL